MSKKTVLFIVNPISGSGNKDDIYSEIKQEIDYNKFNIDIQKTQYAGHAEEMAKQAVKNNIDIVVAVGGDGTVNEVARAIVTSNTALGIIPSGSGNGLARHLHLPLETKKAIHIINDDIIHDLDYGMINHHPFFCTCGVGFDALISKKFAEAGKRGIKTYIETVLREGFSYKSQTYTIEDINHKKKYKAFLIACANASQYGNNAYIAPHASMKDGLLDIVIMEPFNPIDIPQILFQLFNKNLDKNSHIKTFKTSKLKIKRDDEGVIHFDGDPIMESKEISIELIHKKFKVIVNKNAKHQKNNLANYLSDWLKSQFNIV